MELLCPQNNPAASFYTIFTDVKLYFDSEINDSGTWILKITNLPGDMVGMIREKESQMWKNNKGKYLCSALIERTSYKLMIEIKLSKNFIILDENGIPIKPADMLKGDVYTLQTYAKEWKVRRRIGYTFYAESGILKMRAPETTSTKSKVHNNEISNPPKQKKKSKDIIITTAAFEKLLKEMNDDD